MFFKIALFKSNKKKINRKMEVLEKSYSFVGKFDAWLKYAEKIAKEECPGYVWSQIPPRLEFSEMSQRNHTVRLYKQQDQKSPCCTCGHVELPKVEVVEIYVCLLDDTYKTEYWREMCS